MNVRIAQLFSFNAGTWFDDYLQMTEYTVKLWMITNTFDEREQNISIRRIKHFLFEEIENTIFIDSEEKAKCIELARAGLNVTSMPGAPADQLVGIMLFHKLNAIMEDRIKIVEIEISTGTGIVYLHSENETSTDLIQPDWWTKVDLTHCDLDLYESENVLTISKNNVWRDLDLSWTDEPVEVDTGNTVVFANFKSNNDTE